MKQSPFSNPIDDEESFTRGFRLSILGLGLVFCLGISALGLLGNRTRFVSIYNRYFPTPTNTATPAPTLTSTRTTTPTNTFTSTPNLTATESIVRMTGTALAFQSSAQAADQWTEVFSESFNDNSWSWYDQPLDNEYSKITFEIKDGKYRWDALAHKGFIQEMPMPARSVSDLFLTVDIQLGDHTALADYGVVFREDIHGNFYYFAIDSENEYSLFKYYGGEWSTLIDRTPSSVIRKDQPNRLAVIAQGDHIILFINNQFMAEKHDDSLPKGSSSLAMEIFDPDQQAVVEFDNIVVRAPK